MEPLSVSEDAFPKPLVYVCLQLVVRAYRTYATTWQWSGTAGLEPSAAEHLARGPTPFQEG